MPLDLFWLPRHSDGIFPKRKGEACGDPKQCEDFWNCGIAGLYLGYLTGYLETSVCVGSDTLADDVDRARAYAGPLAASFNPNRQSDWAFLNDKRRAFVEYFATLNTPAAPPSLNAGCEYHSSPGHHLADLVACDLGIDVGNYSPENVWSMDPANMVKLLYWIGYYGGTIDAGGAVPACVASCARNIADFGSKLQRMRNYTSFFGKRITAEDWAGRLVKKIYRPRVCPRCNGAAGEQARVFKPMRRSKSI